MQIITKNGKVVATAVEHYTPEVVAQMKREGYRVKEKDVGDKQRGLYGLQETDDDVGRKSKKGARRKADSV